MFICWLHFRNEYYGNVLYWIKENIKVKILPFLVTFLRWLLENVNHTWGWSYISVG